MGGCAKTCHGFHSHLVPLIQYSAISKTILILFVYAFNISWYIPIYPDIFWYIPIYPEISQYIQIYPDIFRFIQIFSDLFWYMYTPLYPDIFWSMQLSWYIQLFPMIYPDISRNRFPTRYIWLHIVFGSVFLLFQQ